MCLQKNLYNKNSVLRFGSHSWLNTLTQLILFTENSPVGDVEVTTR